MLTVQAMHDAIQAAIQRAERAGDAADLHELQKIAGYLMRPAHAAGDGETERAFRILAANAANIRERLLKDEE
ncbi:MAG TPA: hypothetical protein VGE07_26500 [Herpetosiphonaceae bacterium]